ncbi:amine oxidase [flavin-containing] B-like isoform X2 [Belonocnema kinseyi]|uniref:amine oxidase [flavin-containing] B-like isoform X2 n=1 Tax=Belonocnema kinseyi TaxID=2817044 RepID=UPI00143D9600|nr:amine oxidase [flavin-containing] B-like isoform X2 [Belonocnema kinseyi]
MASDFRDEEIQDDSNDFDIIIIGAGITGLTAAHVLLKKKVGLNVLVLEANKTIGGRVFLSEESKAFYGNSLQKHITELLDELKIQVVPKRNNETRNIIFLTKGGPFRKFSSYVAAQVYNFFISLHRISRDFQFRNYTSHEDAQNLAKLSLDELSSSFTCWGAANSICRSLLFISCGISNLKKASALWYLVMVHGAGGFLQRLKITLGDESRFFIKDGMAQLVKELSKQIKRSRGFIKSSEPVLKIQFNDTRAYVTTNQKCYRCDYVVMAVPPPESSYIIIEPSLSPNLSKSQTLFENGKNVFFTAVFEGQCWRDNCNYTGDVLTTSDCDSNLKLAYDATHSDDESQLVLAGFLSESDSQTPEKFKLFDSLNKSFESNTAGNFTSYKERKWMPFNSSESKDAIRGGSPMSCLNPCDLTYHINPLNLSQERILFAASEYATYWPGTIDGAIEAGKMASYSILWRTRPQSLNRSDLSFFPANTTRFHQTSVEFSLIYYMCLAANICIFWSFFKTAY